MRSKVFITAIVCSLFCPPLFAGGKNRLNIPEDAPEYFVQRYKYFIGKEDKNLRKIGEELNGLARKRDDLKAKQVKLNKELDEKKAKSQDTVKTAKNLVQVHDELSRLEPQIDALIDQIEPMIAEFWAKRDTDPATPENEYKAMIDERIEDIEDERYFISVDSPGLTFAANGGFNGDMAKVYILLGAPDLISVIEHQPSIVDLMLWVYGSENHISYALLFYKSSDSSNFRLFPQSNFTLDQCAAINEIMRLHRFGEQGCTQETINARQELITAPASGNIPGIIFLWALMNVSDDPALTQDRILHAPLSASQIAKESKARVIGEAADLPGTIGVDYVLSSCEACKSMIPAQISLTGTLAITAAWGNFDWRIDGELFASQIKVKVIFEDKNNGQPTAFEKVVDVKVPRENVDRIGKDGTIVATLLDANEISGLPAGNYRVTIYISSTMTNKYNQWELDYTKQ